MKLVSFIFLSCLAAGTLFSQATTFYIPVDQTDNAYTAQQDSHAITIDPSVNLGKMLLFLVGTDASTSDYQALRDHAAELGWDVICLSYPDTLPAASLANSTAPSAFDHFREELCYGTPVSPVLAIDSLNSIHTRFLKLLQYLDANNALRNWGQYLSTPSSPDWTKIAVGGHSQGSGHAAYLAKSHPVERILMFAGPNDYSNAFSAPGPWLSSPGISPAERHFSYQSLNDELVDYFKQLANTLALGQVPGDDSTLVDGIAAPFLGSHLLYTEQSPGFVILNHNVPVKNTAKNREVWTYMLSSPIVLGIKDFAPEKWSLSPNPSHDFFILQFNSTSVEDLISIYDLRGHLVQQASSRGNTEVRVDVSGLPAGMYLVEAKGQFFRMVKS